MSTVFQFGQAQLVKDMVFGWCVRKHDNAEWMTINDLPTLSLQELVGATFPSYVPEDFQESIKKEMERRKSSVILNAEVTAMAHKSWEIYDAELAAVKQSVVLKSDRIKLMAEIINNLVVENGVLTSNLNYVKIQKLGNEWAITGGLKPVTETFPNITKAVDRIMAKWW